MSLICRKRLKKNRRWGPHDHVWRRGVKIGNYWAEEELEQRGRRLGRGMKG